jgi:ketosteroid isomerase-like protein
MRELLDKEHIREVLYKCCRAVDRCDIELLKSVYHPDGFNAHGSKFVGNAHDFCDWVIPRLRVHHLIRHTIGNVLIDLRGDEAFCESHYHVSTRTNLPDGRVVDTGSEGRYIDVLVRCEDSQWRIFHRLVVNDKRWSNPVPTQDLGGIQGAPDPSLTPRSDRKDPVYRGFGITELRPPEARDEH